MESVPVTARTCDLSGRDRLRSSVRFARFRGRIVPGAAILLLATGCSELRARQSAREGNRHFREGDYRAAIAAYSESERHRPLAVVALNKGLACRQLLLPGAKSIENDRAIECALTEFQRLRQLSPSDGRAEQLYLQTLFDADRFEQLAKIFQEQLHRSPDDPAALNALVQVFSRAGQWDQALHWTLERARRRASDAEAQYAVGVFVYNRLFDKGGAAEKFTFDPRGTALAPTFAPGDIVGAERVRLAQQGIEHLERAVTLRPGYADALTYLGLLHRQRSLGYWEKPAEWQAAVSLAESFRQRAAAVHTQRSTEP